MVSALTRIKAASGIAPYSSELGNRSVRDIAILAELLVMRVAVVRSPTEPRTGKNTAMLASLLELNSVRHLFGLSL